MNSADEILNRAIETGRVSRRSVESALRPFGAVQIEKQDRAIGGRAGFSRWHISVSGRTFNGDTLGEAFEDAFERLSSAHEGAAK